MADGNKYNLSQDCRLQEGEGFEIYRYSSISIEGVWNDVKTCCNSMIGLSAKQRRKSGLFIE